MATPSTPGLKEYLNNQAPGDETELGQYLDAAIRTVRHRCGPLEPTAVTEQQRMSGGTILVNERPLISLTSVTDSDGVTLDISQSKLDKGAGIIYLGNWLTDLVEVVYQAGYNPAPDDLELATYMVAGHLWDTQRGRSGSFAQIHGLDDDAPVGAEASQLVLQGFAWPRRAMELTRSYVKDGFR